MTNKIICQIVKYAPVILIKFLFVGYENIQFFLQYSDHIEYINFFFFFFFFFFKYSFFLMYCGSSILISLIAMIILYQDFNFFYKKDLFTKEKKNISVSQFLRQLLIDMVSVVKMVEVPSIKSHLDFDFF